MANHPLGNLMEETMSKLRDMVDVNTIIGNTITTPDGTMLIPVSKVSFGFASGGSDFNAKSSSSQNPFGGGAGAGVKIVPVAFVIVKDGIARVMSVDQSATSTVERILDKAPDIIDKVSARFKKDEDGTETEIAPEE